MSDARPRVAFVVARCGDDIVGGAENLCAATARAMAGDWDVEILTTCARDARTWADAYSPGATTIGGVPAHRFSVPKPRDPARFDRMSERVVRGATTPPENVAWMRAQGPVAPGLATRLRDARPAYDRVVFYSYLYATTYDALPVVADRSVLVPLAHREWMLDLDVYDRVFSNAAAFAYLSDEERATVERRYPPASARAQRVVGVGIEPPHVEPERFVRERALDGDLIVCVGRVEEAKGTAELIAYFCALQRADPKPRTLVLVGPIAMAIPNRPDIRALGQVTDREKWDALAAATLVCVPSTFESLSLAALEAWSVGSPILANGGLWYANEAEFVELAQSSLFGLARELGANGRAYVRANYTWRNVRAAYSELAFPSA